MNQAESAMPKQLALVTAITTVVLIAIGNVVSATGSGMGCGDDWPDCHGAWIPQFYNHTVVIEFGHRVVAALVSVMTLALLVIVIRRRSRELVGPAVAPTVAAAVLLVAQVLLGGLTVIWEIPREIISIHMGVSTLYLSAVVLVWWRLGRREVPVRADGAPLVLARVVFGLAFFQILVGAWMRHNGAGLACPDIPLCHGSLVPDGSIQTIHMLHRVVGVVLAGLTMPLMANVRRDDRTSPVAARAARILVWVVLVQVVLGFGSVLFDLAIPMTTLHVIVAAGIISLCVVQVELLGGFGRAQRAAPV